MRIPWRRPVFPILCVALLSLSGHSQTLAHKNWAGSGVTVEPWWRRAVFYRIDPARFQDSDGDGKGDLAGVAQRLDYLQSLGVDALLLDASGNTLDDGSGMPATEGFDDLARAAVGHHLRLIVALGAPASQSPASDAQYLAIARSWLNQGAAGVYIPSAALTKIDGTYHIAALLHQLRLLTNSFPGGRVLIAGAPALPDPDLLRALQKEAHLTASPAILSATPTATNLRSQLETALSNAATISTRARLSAADPLLLAARVSPQTDKTTQDSLQHTLAAMLLASRSAVILEYGQELGLIADAGSTPLMQWTPSNVTQKPPPPEPKAAEAPAAPEPEYHAFHELIPPPRKDLLPPPKMPLIVVSDDPQPVVIDPNTLPGFTSGTLDLAVANTNGATANVAIEQADPKSLLNFYRQLIQLHHDNPTARNGTQTVLNSDATDTLTWIRHAPSGARTAASVVVVCRLGTTVGNAVVKVARSLVGASGDAVFIGETR